MAQAVFIDTSSMTKVPFYVLLFVLLIFATSPTIYTQIKAFIRLIKKCFIF